ncbi:MAG: Ig-like domain repeat protein [Methanobrevibacter sp.]|nr:Ig-like domain repeat protein [Methanobrevibacter sp.]
MKFSRLIFIILILSAFLTAACVSAADNQTADSITDLSSQPIDIYVDDTNGNDANDGMSPDSSVKTFNRAIQLAGDNSTVHMADGIYNDADIVIDKSVSVVGSDNTVFDGQNINHMFTVNDNAVVMFKNIKFANAFKKPEKYSSEIVYGSVFDIKNAKVTLDNCQFINNAIRYDSTVSQNLYGGAISNFGDLTLINSYFNNNSITAVSGLYGYGASVYNKGKLTVINSSFVASKSNDFVFGGAIANEGVAIIKNSIIRDSFMLQECKGSAIYNNGTLTLTDSIIENNTVSRSDFSFIYGAIYNSGSFMAQGNIFRKNNAVYAAPADSYKGSPTIYNVGKISLKYNAFMDNAPFNGIARDLYYYAGEIITFEDNWWATNENPYDDGQRVNVDEVSSWLVFTLNPEYSPLNISDSVKITASWALSSGVEPEMELFPKFNVTFYTVVNGEEIIRNEVLNDGTCQFDFTYTQNKGSYNLLACVEGFNQSAIIDVGKLNSYLKYNLTSNITYLDEFNLDFEVKTADSGSPTGIVSVYLDGEIHNITLKNGKGNLHISDLSPNTYKLKMVYQGDENYFKAFENVEVSVMRSPVELTVSAKEIYIGSKGNAVVSLGPKGAQGRAILYVDGKQIKYVYLYNGNSNIALNNFAEGKYNITIEYLGSDKYEPQNASCIFIVKKYDTALALDVGDTPAGENITLKITVEPKDLRGKAILRINGVNSTIFLDNNVTTVNLHSFAPGEYDVDVIFEGDVKYAPAKSSASFKVYNNPSNITAEITQNDDILNGTVLVKLNPLDCTGVVGVYINYRLYKMNLTSGQARFDVVFDKGTNYIFVFYEGDGSYESSTWNTTIGVADEFILIGENTTVFEHNNFNYTIRLIEPSGVPMPSRKLTVKIDGETYNLTTDDSGISYLLLNLDAGEYEAATTYLNKTVLNKISVKPIKFNITSDDVFYGENLTIVVGFDKNLTGKANIRIENQKYSADIADGRAIFNVSLNVGKYVVKARYSNEFFNSTEIEGSFEVKKANVTYDIIILPAIPGDNQTIKIIFSKNTTGNVTVAVDNESCIVDILGDEAILVVSNITSGKHSLDAYYPGDSNYNPLNISSSFYVKEFTTDLIVTIEDGVYGEDLYAVARIDENATGNITFKVSDLSKTVEVKKGIARWTFNGIDAGNYTLEAYYSGNTYYQSQTNSTSFNVKKANSTIELFTLDVCLNENIIIYAKLSPNATGHVSFAMVSYYSPRDKEIANSMSVWYIAPLKTGKYTVIATYNGDKDYYASNTTFILDVSQRRSILNVEINDAGVNDNVIVKISLKSDNGTPITSKVHLTVDKRTYNLNIVDGEFSLNMGKLSIGNHSYRAVYDGSAEYAKASAEGTFKVLDTLLTPKLTSNNVTKYYKGSEKIVAKLAYFDKPIAGETVYVKINGVMYPLTTDEKGEVSLPVNLRAGKYSVEITSAETKTYRSVSLNITVTILATVEGIDVTKAYGSSDQYYAIFVDSNGNALGACDVKFTIAGKSYTVKTLPNGVARININFSPGKYTITAINPVTGEKTSNTIIIFYRLAENKDLTKLYGAAGAYKVRAYGDNGKPVGAGEIVKVTINGVTYDCKTDKNGYVSVNINLAPKTYTITALYKGYKVSNKVVIKPLLSASDVSIKKSSAIPFSAKLVDSNGKPSSGKTVTFKINGKTFTAKTNSKGIATIKINLSLNVGTYSIVSTYGKSTIANRIIVKK